MFETDDGKLIPAYQVYKHPGVRVAAATLHIKSKKNDQAGTGFRYNFIKALPVFYIPSLDWTQKPPYFAEEPRRLAVANGIDPTRVSATTLAAAGLTREKISTPFGSLLSTPPPPLLVPWFFF